MQTNATSYNIANPTTLRVVGTFCLVYANECNSCLHCWRSSKEAMHSGTVILLFILCKLCVERHFFLFLSQIVCAVNRQRARKCLAILAIGEAISEDKKTKHQGKSRAWIRHWKMKRYFNNIVRKLRTENTQSVTGQYFE